MRTSLLVLWLSGCASLGPRTWRPDQHMDVLAECRAACSPRGMGVYEPYTGRCECAVPLLKEAL